MTPPPITKRELAIFRLAYSLGSRGVENADETWAEKRIEQEDPYLPKDPREAEIARWRSIALYAADVHAATAGNEASLKSVPASRKERLFSICRTLSNMILGTETPAARYSRETPEEEIRRIVDRLREAETYRY